jgi:hypothetical protein
LSDLEDNVYSNIPAGHDSAKLSELIQATRLARQNNDTEAYKNAIIDLMNFQLDSLDPANSYTPHNYVSDGFLDPKSVAMINARFRNKARTGTTPVNISQSYDAAIIDYRDALPDLRPLYAGVSGSWDIKGAKAHADSIKNDIFDAFTNNGVSRPEALYKAQLTTIDSLKSKVSDQKTAHIEVTDANTGNIVVVHMAVDGTGKLSPKASHEDFAATSAALGALREGGLYKEKVRVHLLDNSSALPAGISGVDGNTIGFTYDNADAIHIYVDKVSDQISIAKGHPGYWSTSFSNKQEAYKHFIAHEVGHQLSEKLYGSQNSKRIGSDLHKFYNAAPESSSTSVADSTLNTAGPSDDANNIAAAQSTPTDLSSWNNVGGAQGSNPGGTWQDPTTGTKVYAKFQKTELHGQNERLASALYKFLGIDTADILPANINGRAATYAEYVAGVQENFDAKVNNDAAYLKKVQEGFAVDAFLGNWDAPYNNNIVTDANGNPVRIDVGGALLYRARGDAKGSSFGDSVTELGTFTSGGTNSGAVRLFSSMSQQDQTDSAKRLLKLADSDISTIVDSIITDPTVASSLKGTLQKRRDYILGRYGLTGDQVQAKASTSSDKSATDNPVPDVSTRGAASPAENFAELFAQMVASGNGAAWFENLLESYGYAKGKKSTAWRQKFKDAFGQAALSLIDTVLAENNSANYPEMDRTKYGPGTIFGSRTAQRLGRILGFGSNKPQLVDDFTPGWSTVFRGVNAATTDGTHYSGKDLHRAFATGSTPSYYSTTTAYGDGTYTAGTSAEARGYGSVILEMAIDPKAKVAVLGRGRLGFSKDSNMPNESVLRDALDQMMRSLIANELDPGTDEASSDVISRARGLVSDLPINKASSYYALAGYDAIEVDGGSGGVSYFVVLNRGILQVRKKDIL